MDGKIDIENQLNQNLKKIDGLTYNDNEIDLNDANKKITKLPVTVKLNGYAFTILENGDVDKIQWIDNNNGSYTNVETGQTLTVGDIVKYETILNSNAVDSTKLTQLKSDLQAYSGDSSSTNNANINRDNLPWKILDVKDGTIRLISANPTTKAIKLYGENGYNNAVFLIDKACDVLYSSNKGKSQNLKIEDVEECFIYNYKQYTNGTAKYGDTKEYIPPVKLNYPNIYKSEIGCIATSNVENTENTIGLSNQSNLLTGKSTSTEKLKCTQTYWGRAAVTSDFKYPIYFSLFINNGSNYSSYWLSSRYVGCNANYIDFSIRTIKNGGINGSWMFYSTGNVDGGTYALRPVVTLNSDVQLESDGTNTWKIK